MVDVGPAAPEAVAEAMIARKPHFLAAANAAFEVLQRHTPGSPAPDPAVLSTAVRLAAAVMALGLERDAEAAATLNTIERVASPVEDRRTHALDCASASTRASTPPSRRAPSSRTSPASSRRSTPASPTSTKPPCATRSHAASPTRGPASATAPPGASPP